MRAEQVGETVRSERVGNKHELHDKEQSPTEMSRRGSEVVSMSMRPKGPEPQHPAWSTLRDEADHDLEDVSKPMSNGIVRAGVPASAIQDTETVEIIEETEPKLEEELRGVEPQMLANDSVHEGLLDRDAVKSDVVEPSGLLAGEADQVRDDCRTEQGISSTDEGSTELGNPVLEEPQSDQRGIVRATTVEVVEPLGTELARELAESNRHAPVLVDGEEGEWTVGDRSAASEEVVRHELGEPEGNHATVDVNRKVPSAEAGELNTGRNVEVPFDLDGQDLVPIAPIHVVGEDEPDVEPSAWDAAAHEPRSDNQTHWSTESEAHWSTEDAASHEPRSGDQTYEQWSAAEAGQHESRAKRRARKRSSARGPRRGNASAGQGRNDTGIPKRIPSGTRGETTSADRGPREHAAFRSDVTFPASHRNETRLRALREDKEVGRSSKPVSKLEEQDRAEVERVLQELKQIKPLPGPAAGKSSAKASTRADSDEPVSDRALDVMAEGLDLVVTLTDKYGIIGLIRSSTKDVVASASRRRDRLSGGGPAGSLMRSWRTLCVICRMIFPSFSSPPGVSMLSIIADKLRNEKGSGEGRSSRWLRGLGRVLEGCLIILVALSPATTPSMFSLSVARAIVTGMVTILVGAEEMGMAFRKGRRAIGLSRVE